MHSILSRLRGRIASPPAEGSGADTTSPNERSPTPPAPGAATLPTAYPVSRQILPDIASLFENYSADESPSTGLKPPRRSRRRAPVVHPALVDEPASEPPANFPQLEAGPPADAGAHQSTSQTPQHQPYRPENRTTPEHAARASVTPSQRSTRSRLSRLSRQLASTSPWATFGRSNEQRSPDHSTPAHPPSAWPSGSTDSLGQRYASYSRKRRVHSKQGSIASVARYGSGAPSRASSEGYPAQLTRRSSLSRLNDDNDSDDTHAYTPDTPQQTNSSLNPSPHDSVPSTNSRPNMTHSAGSTPSHSIIGHTLALRTNVSMADSPHTFGIPSPLPHSRSRHSRLLTSSSSPPPPLPPLDHPELLLALSSFSRVNLPLDEAATAAISIDKPSKWALGLHARTYPPRRRHKTDGSVADPENVDPRPGADADITPSRQLRRYASLPRVFRGSYASSGRPSRAQTQRRAQTDSGRPLSADWNAQQQQQQQQQQQRTSALLPSEFGQLARQSFASGEGTMTGASPATTGALLGSGDAEPRVSQVVPCQSESQWLSYPALIPTRSGSSPAPATAQGGEENPHHDHPRGTETETKRGKSADIATATPPQERATPAMATPVPGAVTVQTRSRDDVESSVHARRDAQDTLRRDTLRRSVSASVRTGASASEKGRERRTSYRSASDTYIPPSSTPPRTPPRNLVPSTPPVAKNRISSISSHASEGLHAVPETPTVTTGKRKAEDSEIDASADTKSAQHATFLLPEGGHRTHKLSEASAASYFPSERKRARLSSTTPQSSRPNSALSASNMSSWPSRTGPPPSLLGTPPRAPSAVSRHDDSARHSRHDSSVRHSRRESTADRRSERERGKEKEREHERRRSVSEASIPISAIVRPHAPSIARSSMYHMRDPRRLHVRRTEWVPRLASEEEGASPLHAWAFFVGFVLFPLWWLAAVWPVPRTREVGGSDTEKAVTLDDPQVEHDARTWRKRCRVMSVISVLTYIPFIVLVAIFVPRHT